MEMKVTNQPEPAPPIEVEIFTLGKMLKEGHAREFTVYSDEGPRVGGEGNYPTPLLYFTLSIGF
jgi:hypothetical protein